MDKVDHNEFTYIERLDLIHYSTFPSTLKLNENPTPESLLFRLMLGTLDVYSNDIDKLISHKISYDRIRDTFTDNESENPLVDWLSTEFGIFDLNNYFKINERKNRLIFDELLSEFTQFIVNKHEENHVAGFLNLYRFLEYISFSFPMIFSSLSTNYYNSYDTIKSFFVNKEEGQLKFFSKFVSLIFPEFTLRCKTSIDTYSDNNTYNTRNRQVIQKLCSGLDYSDNGSIFSIRYQNLLDFMINLRNSYFHFQSDRRNNISNIGFNSNLFFSALNDKFANWLSLIYQEILRHGVFKLNLIPYK